jgi:predicted 3-demethylubiquinone-9 3-methyltransferase (glyoxalase superfamily)
MIKKPYTCLWFAGNAHEAATYYVNAFENATVLSKGELVSMVDIQGTKIKCLNGGPHYKHTPAISQFVTCETNEEIDQLWNYFIQEGKILMNLGKYDWSEYYGWCEDKYGVTWQLFKGNFNDVNQKVVPCFLFTDENFGKAEETQLFYLKTISNSVSEGIKKYENATPELNGKVLHSQFRLNDTVFMAMDGPGEHHFTFSPATSFVIECETQEEIDFYWEELGKGGKYNKCGWLDDQFGVSWQIVPSILGELMRDPIKAPKVVQAFMQMSKFEIAPLLTI